MSSESSYPVQLFNAERFSIRPANRVQGLEYGLNKVGDGVTEYAYTGWQVTEEFDGSDNQKAWYVYGLYIDEPVYAEHDTNADGDYLDAGEKKYYTRSSTYNVMGVTDVAGNLLEHYRYDAYGQASVYTGAGNTNARILFALKICRKRLCMV